MLAALEAAALQYTAKTKRRKKDGQAATVVHTAEQQLRALSNNCSVWPVRSNKLAKQDHSMTGWPAVDIATRA
jgi:hypothetical protein